MTRKRKRNQDQSTVIRMPRTWKSVIGRPPNIEYVETPAEIRDSYQYFTQAEVANLQRAGYKAGFAPLEDTVRRYVTQFLDRADRYR